MRYLEDLGTLLHCLCAPTCSYTLYYLHIVCKDINHQVLSIINKHQIDFNFLTTEYHCFISEVLICILILCLMVLIYCIFIFANTFHLVNLHLKNLIFVLKISKLSSLWGKLTSIPVTSVAAVCIAKVTCL